MRRALLILLEVGFAGVIVAGTAMIWVPAALIVAGVMGVWALERRT